MSSIVSAQVDLASKLILVMGATGAQGTAVIEALLLDSVMYRIRVFTRDASNPRFRALKALDPGRVESFEGSMYELDQVEAAMQGCHGVFINIDGFSCGEKNELFLGISIFEIAKRVKGLKHYVFSNLDYMLKKGNYESQYHCSHYDAKGRVADWLKSQESSPEGLVWSVLTTGPYMDMLYIHMFAPVKQREDGTYVFAAPLNDGHVPMIALSDLGYYARYIFDHREEMSAVDLEVASDMVSWDYLVKTFTKVTGKKGEYVRQTLDEFFELRSAVADKAVAHDLRKAEEQAAERKNITFRENFSGFWSSFRDDIIKRDMDYLTRIHPNRLDLEKWMREVKYTGDETKPLLKDLDTRPLMLDAEKVALL